MPGQNNVYRTINNEEIGKNFYAQVSSEKKDEGIKDGLIPPKMSNINSRHHHHYSSVNVIPSSDNSGVASASQLSKQISVSSKMGKKIPSQVQVSSQ